MSNHFETSAPSARSEQRLTGPWQAWPVPLHADLTGTTPPDDAHTLPECTHLQPALYPDDPYWGSHLRALNETGWAYQRRFTAHASPGQRARLRFDGVDYFAAVWLNDTYLGEHEGHFAPFEFDVTDSLRAGENVLTVRVSSPWDPPNPKGSYPSDHVIRGLVKGHYEHGEGVIPPDVNPLGIWQPVWLVHDNGIDIQHLGVQASANGTVTVTARVRNATGEVWHGDIEIVVRAENHDGPSATLRETVDLSSGEAEQVFTLTVPEPRLWWPREHGQPNLYQLTLSLTDAERCHARSSTLLGLRDVTLDRSPERFVYRINGREVAIRGSSYMPALYMSQVTTETLARDLQFALDANLNLIRVHVHVSPQALYELCDRAGMLVWQDFELNWVQDPSPAFEARARRMQREMIDLLGNHPCIITWACHNEPTMVFLRRHNLERHPDPALYADALAQDPSRPVFISSGQLGDDWQRSGDMHSYFGAIWSHRYTDVYNQRFKLNTEFGFEAPASLETLKSYPKLWDRLNHLEGEIDELWTYQAGLVQFHVEHLRRLRSSGCAGYIHFWLADMVPQVGCGILDAHRVPKGGYDALRLASQPLLPMLEHDGDEPYALWVLNDTPAEYPGARLTWTVFDSTGTMQLSGEASVDIAANQAQRVVSAEWIVIPRQCARVDLRLIDQHGQVLSSNHYDHPFIPLPRPRGYPWRFDRDLGMKVFDRPGAPSLADGSGNVLFKALPLSAREALTEWALRQQLPTWLVSLIGRVGDALY